MSRKNYGRTTEGMTYRTVIGHNAIEAEMRGTIAALQAHIAELETKLDAALAALNAKP